MTRYRLLITLPLAETSPVAELAAYYHARWQVEAMVEQLKPHLQQGRRTLPFKTPELVRQAFYGWVLTPYAVHWLMHQVASEHRSHHGQ
ncbi:hypothetical protein [Chitinimonas lacunae]|uniref:Transposase n=1 Tax=Chitinimonas lacunae TaxID=1963018 RepID=A0ABV8MUF4_9NEIS